MTEQFANQAQSTLKAVLLSSATSLEVVSGSSFPGSGNFRVVIGNEIMLATARSGNVLTVTRAQEGTTAVKHETGVPVEHVLTAASAVLLVQQNSASKTEVSAAITTAEAASDAAGTATTAVATERTRAEAAEPTPGQKNALAGANGTPGTGNEYLTKQSKGSAGEAGKVMATDDPAVALLEGGKLKESELPNSVASISTGEGAPAKGLALNRLYIQTEGAKHIALWRGLGAGEEPEQIADLSGTPADGSVTAAKVAAANLDGAVGTASMRTLVTALSNDNLHAPTAEAVQKAIEALTPIYPIDYMAQVVAPLVGRSLIPSAVGSAIGTANKGIFMRAIVPRTGTLHDLAVANGEVVNGNHIVAVFDTGAAAATEYTLLWESGSVAAAGEKAWQVVGDPALAVTAGQQILIAVMNSGTTHKFGTYSNNGNAALSQLPTNFLPLASGNLPKLIGFHAYSEFKFKTITEAGLSSYGTPIAMTARVA